MAGKKKIVVICGPTATGKTGLSIELSKMFDGEIISADSMQIYRKLDIGTAKATEEEQTRIKHHLIDIMDPDEPYNVQLFVSMAAREIDEISCRKKVPFIVGGTGLYIESLVNGIVFSQQDDNVLIKEELKKELSEKGSEYMYGMLCEIDPEYAKNVHPNNTVRVLRALEVYRLTGHSMTWQIQNSLPQEKPYDYLIIGMNFHDRQVLYDRINRRIDIMLSKGLLEEAKYVWLNRSSFKTCTAAIGYKEFFPYFEGEQTLEECIDKLKQASRNYAKRQLTWFNRMKDVNWIYPDDENYLQGVKVLVGKFLGKMIYGQTDNRD